MNITIQHCAHFSKGFGSRGPASSIVKKGEHVFTALPHGSGRRIGGTRAWDSCQAHSQGYEAEMIRFSAASSNDQRQLFNVRTWERRLSSDSVAWVKCQQRDQPQVRLVVRRGQSPRLLAVCFVRFLRCNLASFSDSQKRLTQAQELLQRRRHPAAAALHGSSSCQRPRPFRSLQPKLPKCSPASKPSFLADTS